MCQTFITKSYNNQYLSFAMHKSYPSPHILILKLQIPMPLYKALKEEDDKKLTEILPSLHLFFFKLGCKTLGFHVAFYS